MTFFLITAASIHGAYQIWGEAGVTNWDVAYNVSNYMLFAAVAYEEATKYKKAVRWMMRMMCVFFTYYMFVELTYINKSYEVYKSAMVGGAFYKQMFIVLCAVLFVGLIDRIKIWLNAT